MGETHKGCSCTFCLQNTVDWGVPSGSGKPLGLVSRRRHVTWGAQCERPEGAAEHFQNFDAEIPFLDKTDGSWAEPRARARARAGARATALQSYSESGM